MVLPTYHLLRIKDTLTMLLGSLNSWLMGTKQEILCIIIIYSGRLVIEWFINKEVRIAAKFFSWK